MNNSAAMQAMQMQLGGSAAPRLRSSHVRASWTAMPSCTPGAGAAFATGHVSFLGLTNEKTQDVVIAKAENPAYHRQPEEFLT